MSHFRVQYAAVLLVFAAVLFIARQWKTAVSFVFFAVLNCVVIVPHCCLGHTPGPASGQTLRLLLLNVRAGSEQFGLVESSIREANADVIVVEEVNNEWLGRLLSVMCTNYPYSVQQPRDDNFGIALFSRLPLESPGTIYLGEAGVPSVSAILRFEGKAIRVLGTHPLPPAGAESSHLRNQQLVAIATFLRGRPGPKILLGDLNATPWSQHFRDLLRDTGLTDTSRGFGLQPTWPASFVPVRIPIDHCLVSADLQVVSRKIGTPIGSDHLPLVLDLTLAY